MPVYIFASFKSHNIEYPLAFHVIIRVLIEVTCFFVKKIEYAVFYAFRV